MVAARTADYWIERLDLREHPEGGYFRETYRSEEMIEHACLHSRYGGRRSVSTSIYFLLRGSQTSRLHRLQSDELWHYYDGSTVTLHIITPDGYYVTRRIGLDAESNPQGIIPAGCWFGATVDDPDGFVLVGCTVAPGFDVEDFEMGSREELIGMFPDHRAVIEQLTPEPV
jgi:predicted cupin superfamily sugar epimerase